MNEELRRTVPHSLSAERAVIGSMLIDNDTIEDCIDILMSEDFYQKLYGEIFKVITELYSEKQAVDEVTISSRIDGKNLGINIEELLREIILEVPTSIHASSYAQTVKDKSVLRTIIKVGQELEERCFAEKDSVDDILSDSEKDIFAINQRRGSSDEISMRQIVLEEVSLIEAASRNKQSVTGVPSGFIDLDRVTQGFQKSDLIIVAARPAMGKTAFVLNIADYVSIHEKKRVAIFSLEMSKGQLVRRLMSVEGNIDAGKLRSGQLAEADWERLIDASGRIGMANMKIDDTPGISLGALKRKCRKYAAEEELALIIIDYLQLMKSDGRAESRQNEVAEISRGLKGLAKELNVPVIALSQLSRNVEERIDKRPVMSDLRESGAIEQDADIVMFLYRDDYYNHDSEEKNISEVIISKHRSGGLGTVKLAWMPEYTRFANLNYQKE